MSRWPVILLITALGCGAPGAPIEPGAQPAKVAAPSAPPAPSAPTKIPGETATDLVEPPPGRTAAIFHTDDHIAVTLDEAGIARHTGSPVFLGQTQRWIPFSEPVSDVVYIRQFARPPNRPGAQMGRMFCARTRAATVECVIDFEPTPKDPRLVRRFRLPFEGPVRHLGVFSPWRGSNGPDRVVCALGAAPSCWFFDWEATRAERYPIDAATAEAASLRIRSDVRAAWLAAAPGVTADRVLAVLLSDGQDSSHIAGPDVNIAVHCARLEGGELSCFGPNVHGLLGEGDLGVASRASRPLNGVKVVALAMLGHHACAVVADGRVACWGELPGDFPVPAGHPVKRLPPCPLDRAKSLAKFNADRAAAVKSAEACARTCKGGGRDACLGCVVGCTEVPYLFRHEVLCQEPLGLPSTLAQRGITCAEPPRPAQWLSDKELQADTPEAVLTTTPVYLSGITDAVDVALPGRPSLCILRRGGGIACIDDNGRLSAKP